MVYKTMDTERALSIFRAMSTAPIEKLKQGIEPDGKQLAGRVYFYKVTPSGTKCERSFMDTDGTYKVRHKWRKARAGEIAAICDPDLGGKWDVFKYYISEDSD
jgi:hypothetical protein